MIITMKHSRPYDVNTLKEFRIIPFLSFLLADANRAKNIKNKPRINEDPRDAQMKLLQDEINRLKQELLSAGNPSARNNQMSSSENNNVCWLFFF